jgi:hypothetical protein
MRESIIHLTDYNVALSDVLITRTRAAMTADMEIAKLKRQNTHLRQLVIMILLALLSSIMVHVHTMYTATSCDLSMVNVCTYIVSRMAFGLKLTFVQM